MFFTMSFSNPSMHRFCDIVPLLKTKWFVALQWLGSPSKFSLFLCVSYVFWVPSVAFYQCIDANLSSTIPVRFSYSHPSISHLPHASCNAIFCFELFVRTLLCFGISCTDFTKLLADVFLILCFPFKILRSQSFSSLFSFYYVNCLHQEFQPRIRYVPFRL